MPLPFLIGGAPGAGKSTVAKALAQELGVSSVSTDDIRASVQTGPRKSAHHYPWLFSNATISAEDYWKNHSPNDVLQLEIEQGRELWSTLKATIAKRSHGLIEGASLLPELLWQEFGKDARACFIIDPDGKRVRKTIMERGLWGDANTYADWIKPLELEWVMLHNQWLREEVKKYHYPLIEVGDRVNLLDQVKSALKV